MSYVKLDTDILDSTLWIDRDAREIFITALLLAVPFEVRESMPQYEVRSLAATAFIVPPGWYGFVRAAGVGIIRRALLEQESGLGALERLGAPDEESRSQSWEGRRLVRVNGGYIVLNFFSYRDRDHTSATRQKNYRDRKKSGMEAKILEQNCLCDCCRNVLEEPYVSYVVQDHHHESGLKRGVICRSCNALVGQVESDKPAAETRDYVIAYIERWSLRYVTESRRDITQAVGSKHKAKAEEVVNSFELAWSIYPSRGDHGNPKAPALKAWRARIAANVLPEDLIAGIERYAKFCDATGKTGSEFVKMASTFFGPSKFWLEPWKSPARSAGSREARNDAEITRFARGE